MKLNNKLIAIVFLALCSITQWAHAGSYAQTRYPIVLVHGLAGASKYFGLVDYWWQIPQDLRANGAYVYVADVSAFAGEDTRGEALVSQIRAVLAATGASKVNLIGHSQGGFTSRYAAAAVPQLVASVTTIGTPHRGTGVADYVASTPAVLQNYLAGGASTLGDLIGLFLGNPQKQDPLAALHLLTAQGSAEFNQRIPSAGLVADCNAQAGTVDVRDGNRQQLYSWTGNAQGTNILDLADPVMVIGGWVMNGYGQNANDGLVPVCSARFGKVLGTYSWNHIDEVNHLFGLRGLFSADPVAVIRSHANRLKLAGL